MADGRFTYTELLSEVLEEAAKAAGVPAENCNGTTHCFYCTGGTRPLQGAVAEAEDEAGKKLQAEHKAAQLKKVPDEGEQERREILECEKHLQRMLERIAEIKKEKGIQ